MPETKRSIMKTVRLKTGELALPVNIKGFLKRSKLIGIIGDLLFHKEITSTCKKMILMGKVRDHMKYQGVTVFEDWYEDTQDQQEINNCYKEAAIIVSNLFPELNDPTPCESE